MQRCETQFLNISRTIFESETIQKLDIPPSMRDDDAANYQNVLRGAKRAERASCQNEYENLNK